MSAFLSGQQEQRPPARTPKQKPQPELIAQPAPNPRSTENSLQLYAANLFNNLFNGEKFPGGYGGSYQNYEFIDYWELRNKSVELFTKNLYASGLINRLVTNIINTGLSIESTPVNSLIPGMDDDQASDWSENVENLWRIWGNQKDLVDWKQDKTEGELQAAAKKTAYISGDCLVVLRQSKITGLPITELIDGRHIQDPVQGNHKKNAKGRGNTIKHGVEVDKNGRHIAYYTNKVESGKVISKRIPAKGANSGRKNAWLLYGSKRLLDDVRGLPLLGIVAQSLNEIDRYRDSEQRAATVNSMLAMFVRKTQNVPGTTPLTGGGIRKDAVGVPQADGTEKDYNISKWLPGTAIDELAVGEEPFSFDTKRPNSGFHAFEEAIISAIAWANEIPPEILKLSFSSNYSSARMNNSEFSIVLDKERFLFSSNYCKPRFENWLISMVLTGRIKAPGLLEAYRNPALFEIFGAWTDSDWLGAIKPHVDPLKETKAYELKIDLGLITRARAARELTNTKYSSNAKQLEKENQQMAKANQPLVDAGLAKGPAQKAAETDQKALLTEMLGEIIDEAVTAKLEQEEIVN